VGDRGCGPAVKERLQAPAPLLAWFSLVTVWIVWASTYLGIRVAVETIPPFLMAGVRYVIAGALLHVIMRTATHSAYRPFTRAELNRTAISGLLLLVGGNGLLCFAEQRVPSGVAALAPAVEMFIGGLGQIVVALCIGEFRNFHPAAVSLPSIWGFLWLVTAGAMLGCTAYAYAVRTLPARITATYAYVNPIVAVTLGATILSEPITTNVVAGGSIIIASVVAIMIGRTTPP
jgi:drug/metabolite transporter (DMT)-like permease